MSSTPRDQEEMPGYDFVKAEAQEKARLVALAAAADTRGPLSPFLPGTRIQFAWDSTSLGWLKTCPRLYQYSMIEQWRSRGNSVHLDFGLWYHSALELYDKQRSLGAEHEDALREVVKQCMEWTWVRHKCQACGGDGVTNSDRNLGCTDCSGTGEDGRSGPWDSGHNLKTRETLVRSVIWYIEQFADDSCTTVQLASGKPAVELSFKLEMDWGPKAGYLDEHTAPIGEDIGALRQPYVLSGHLDRVVQFQGAYYVMDRKTSSTTIGSYYFDQYDPDNQMSLYSMAARVIYNAPVRGVIIDAAQIAVGFSRFTRGFTFRTEAQIEEWLGETRAWLSLAEHYATVGHWPMNDKSCHQYGGCVFRKVCSKSPEVRQKFLETDFLKKEWNPLVPR